MDRHRFIVLGLLLGIQILGLAHHAWADVQPVSVPEPSMLSLFVGSGIACFGVEAWRRLRRK
jgi:hypothetical protein